MFENMKDKVLLTVAVVISVIGVYAYYSISDRLFQVLSVLVALILTLIVFHLSPTGKRFTIYLNASINEGKKVVWPKMKETNRMTLLVILFIMVLSLIMWLLDSILSYTVYDILLR